MQMEGVSDRQIPYKLATPQLCLIMSNGGFSSLDNVLVFIIMKYLISHSYFQTRNHILKKPLNFLRFIFNIFKGMCLCLYINSGACRGRNFRFSGVTGSCEQVNVDARKKAQVLYKSSTCS